MFKTGVEKVQWVEFVYINSRGNGFEKKIIRIEFCATSGAGENKNFFKLEFII